MTPLALALALPLAEAQTQPNKLDQVVVTAGRMPQRLGDVLADLTVISREQIERQAFGTVADLLRNNGCAEMTRNGGPTSNTSVFLRGAEGRHTVVLLDGVRIDSQSTGGASWQALPLGQIERVEVLKGPASAVYGSDAIGGVVQIITRKGANTAPRIELGASAGSLNTYKLNAAISGGSERFDYALSVAGEKSDGFNATTPLSQFSYVPDRDGWRAHNANLRLGANIVAGHRVELVAIAAHADAQYDASASKPLADDHAIQDNQALRAAWTAQWSEALRTELSIGEGRDKYETKPSIYQTETKIRSIALLGSYAVNKQHQLNFQLERREDELANTSLRNANKRDKRHQDALAAGWLYNTTSFDLQAHARHDKDSEFGGVDTGTLATGFKLAENLRLYASTGTAFRAPSLYQRGSQYGPNTALPGVEALKPERGHNNELGLRYDNGRLDIGATAYRNKVDNLIIFGSRRICFSNSGCYENVAKARLQGLTLSAGAQLGVVRLSGTLDFQSPKDEDTGKLLRRRAKTHGTLRAETSLGDWNLGASVQASGKRWEDANNQVKLGGYALANFDLQYRLNSQLKLQFNVDNAFDSDYQTARGFAQAPMTVTVGLRYTPSF